MWQLAATLWHLLSQAEQEDWETAGSIRHMTGYAYYMSQALRPNPGVYLPLAGGTMTGDIDTGGHRVTGLTDPTQVHHAARKGYVDAEIAGAALGQGARVRRTTNQAIASGAPVLVTYDTEDYDTDGLWEAGDGGRLTVRTAGLYLVIGQVHWEGPSITGYRITYLSHSVAGYIAQSIVYHSHDTLRPFGQVVSTWPCIVGNAIQMYVYQNTGGNLNIMADGFQAPSLQAVRIGP